MNSANPKQLNTFVIIINWPVAYFTCCFSTKNICDLSATGIEFFAQKCQKWHKRFVWSSKNINQKNVVCFVIVSEIWKITYIIFERNKVLKISYPIFKRHNRAGSLFLWYYKLLQFKSILEGRLRKYKTNYLGNPVTPIKLSIHKLCFFKGKQ